jgi:hypothetical protein
MGPLTIRIIRNTLNTRVPLGDECTNTGSFVVWVPRKNARTAPTYACLKHRSETIKQLIMLNHRMYVMDRCVYGPRAIYHFLTQKENIKCLTVNVKDKRTPKRKGNELSTQTAYICPSRTTFTTSNQKIKIKYCFEAQS